MTRQELEKLTKQDAYDLLVKCAEDGTFPSVGVSFVGVSCKGYSGLYRQDRTPECIFRCPGGCFIPDEEYDSKMEGSVVINLKNTLVLPEGLDVIDLRSIQKSHDSLCSNWGDGSAFIKTINSLVCFQDVIKESE